MARGVNKVILIGNLGADPEVRYTNQGKAIANFTMATAESWNDKATGQNQERTEWHRISIFGPLAEIAGKYLKKGSKVYIEGSLRTKKWQDSNGADRWTTSIVANEMNMLDSMQPGQQDQQAQQQTAPASQAQAAQQQSTGAQYQAAQNGTAPAQTGQDAFDDDIPF